MGAETLDIHSPSPVPCASTRVRERAASRTPGYSRLRASSNRRIAAIDGLRAIAVLAVMAFHFGLPIGGGFLGVDLFFVISGFVITRMLLTEQEQLGRIRLGRFWLNRARRLLPALLLVLIAVQLWMRLGAGYSLQQSANGQTLAALGYFSNWFEIFQDGGYWQADAALTPLTHLWSLAVEEQFYLVWPFILIALLRFFSVRGRVIVLTCAAVAAYGLAFILADPANTDRAYQGTDTRSGAILLGALLAVLLHAGAVRWLQHWWVGILSAGVLAVLWTIADVNSVDLYYGHLFLAGLAAFALIGHLSFGAGLFASVLGTAPMRFVGTLSYGLYLWHWPVWVFLTSTPYVPDHTLQIVIAVALSFLLSGLSYALIERPIRHTTSTPARSATLLAAFAIVMAALASSSVFAQPEPPAEQTTGIIVTN